VTAEEAHRILDAILAGAIPRDEAVVLLRAVMDASYAGVDGLSGPDVDRMRACLIASGYYLDGVLPGDLPT
jgi:hypothetical protein